MQCNDKSSVPGLRARVPRCECIGNCRCFALLSHSRAGLVVAIRETANQQPWTADSVGNFDIAARLYTAYSSAATVIAAMSMTREVAAPIIAAFNSPPKSSMVSTRVDMN